MKKFISAALAATAMLGATSAQAQTSQLHYAGGPFTISNPSGIGGAIAAAANEAGMLLGVGTRYTANAGALGNTQTATPTVATAFALTGNVTKDCSFYAGNNGSATAIDFGQIGVRTGNNENVSDAFEMVGPAVAAITSATAGCNFNNSVTLTKLNGNQGLKNAAPGSYDSQQFQANIPYTVQANWTGTPQGTTANGIAQSLTVADTAGTNSVNQGAWRSAFAMAITAPPVNKGLVAGNYSDTLTLTLAAQ
ncbi:hypothetical protein [Sphingosinicella sp. BN140058]|uniref:hypothetical protein n=1 Tax=Sphingosinicella sp. BN140058 TaxID=1892855 RepID=UPI001FB18DF0|nr:hypothetical protein [Sphingosinicella sp. BN140058]